MKVLLFLMALIVLIHIQTATTNAAVVITAVNSVYDTSEQEFGTLHVFNINFDATAVGSDEEIIRGVSKGFLPPSSPNHDLMGIVWNYDTNEIGDLDISTYNHFVYTRESESQSDEFFRIQEGETRQFGMGVTFTVNSGSGKVGVDVIGGHTINGEYFPINMSTKRVGVSSIPEPATGVMVLVGLASLAFRRKK